MSNTVKDGCECPTHKEMRETIQKHNDYLYSYSPTGLSSDLRIVFKYKTFTGRSAVSKAYEYVTKVL